MNAARQEEFLATLSKAGIRGAVKQRGHLNYAIDSVPWNLRVQPKPLAIVYPLDAQDVSRAVKVAVAFPLSVQPRSGGHSFGSFSLGGKDGALVIDLAKLDHVRVDQNTWQATIGGGTKLGKVTTELNAQGQRAIAHGTCPQVGIGGHATIGGQGPLSRMWGLTLDHLLEVEVVLADGTITRASKTQNADLFWALRGAGASFGIITSFVFETHPAPTTVTHYSFQLTFGSPAELANAFAQWQSFISSPAVINDRPFNSVVTVTKSAFLVQGTRYGTRAELEASEVSIHLYKIGEVVKIWELDWLASTVHWASDELNTIAGGLSIPLYVKSLVVRQSKPLTQTALTAWFNYMHDHASHDAIWLTLGDLEAGRISDFSNSDTAYAQRDALTAQPDGDFGAYPGYVDPLIPKADWPKQYWGDNYPRLVEVKRKYDPKNLFSNPQSVGQETSLEAPPKTRWPFWNLRKWFKWFLGLDTT